MQILDVKSIAFRSLAFVLFALGGLAMVVLCGVAPSFWYVPCCWALPLLSLVWAWRPRIAAGLSIGPLFAVACYLRGGLAWQSESRELFVLMAAGLLLAILMIAVSIRIDRALLVLVTISVGFFLASLATDRLFTNKVTVRNFQMQVALDGYQPWTGAMDGHRTSVVLYRRARDGYCYISLDDPEIRNKLAARNGQVVQLEINQFMDFGKERGFNIRSVKGLLVPSEKRDINSMNWSAGQIEGSSGSLPDCW